MKNSFALYSILFLLFVGSTSYLTNQYLNGTKTLKELKNEVSLKGSAEIIPVGCTDGSCSISSFYEAEEKVVERPKITFILGEDNGIDNVYYTAAEHYYRNHPTNKSEWLITHCRSLKQVIDYLEANAKDEAWGEINLVVHANEWMGIGLPVIINGPRITLTSLENALKNKSIEALSNKLIDSKTELNIYGCALGKNEALLLKLGEAFGGSDYDSPTVRSSKYFISYTIENNKTEKYLTDYWHTYYKTGYRPGDIKLANSLKRNNPNANVDFRDALSRKQPRFAGDSYHYYFNVPLQWTVTFPSKEERPSIETKEDQLKFLKEQTELLATIEALKIPIDQFRWQFRNTDYTFEDGETEPAILIKGKSTVLCVLKALTEENSEDPLEPALSDKQFFTTIMANASVGF